MPRISFARSAVFVALLCLAIAGCLSTRLVAQDPGNPTEGLAPEGDPFRGVQDALIRNDRSLAKQRLDAIHPQGHGAERTRTDAKKALLSVALAPAVEQARRYLAVATTYGQERAGLTALVAALHALQLQRELAWFGDSEALQEELDESKPSSKRAIETDLAEALNIAQELLETWQQRQPDLPELAWARALVQSNRQAGTRLHLRIGSGETLPLPLPLTRALTAKAYTWPESAQNFKQFQAMARQGEIEPAFSYKLDGESEDATKPAALSPSIPRPPAGRYLLEIQDIRTGWRNSRTITVSDLILSAHHSPDALVLLATVKKQAQAGVEIEYGDQKVTTDASGKAIIPLDPKATGPVPIRGAYTDAYGTHRASLSLDKATRSGGARHRRNYSTHWMIDRPIYRAGETLRGRVVIRKHAPVPIPSLTGKLGQSLEGKPVDGLTGYVEVQFRNRKRTKVSVRTDSMGVAAFDIPIPSSAVSGDLRITLHGEKKDTDDESTFFIGSTHQGRVLDFRSPPLLMVLTGAATAARRENVEFQVSAAWPWGSPAAFLRGEATLSMEGLHHVVPLVLDANGQARIQAKLNNVPLAKRDLSLFCRATLVTLDGQQVSQSTRTQLPVDDGAKEPISAEDPVARTGHSSLKLQLISEKKAWKVGEQARITVYGPPSSPILVSVARRTLFHTQVVTLDQQGTGAIEFEVQPGWAPTMHVVASIAHNAHGSRAKKGGESYWWHSDAARLALPIKPQNQELAIVLKRDQESYEPGAKARWTMRVSDAAGSPVEATLALSVVDETLFNLARDGLAEPTASLTPTSRWRRLALRWAVSAGISDPLLALGQLLDRGKVFPPSIWGTRRGGRRNLRASGGAGGAYGGRSGLGGSAALREDFRATAFWLPALRTGRDGTVSFEAKFPDNLTTWRITACAVDRGIRGGIQRLKVQTKKAYSANLVTPRLLRSGDALSLPLAIAQDSEGKPTAVSLSTKVGGGLSQRDDADRQFKTQPGLSLSTELKLSAPESSSPSEGLIDLSLGRTKSSGDLDRVRQRFPIQPRGIYRSTSDVALVEGTATLNPMIPEGVSLKGAFTEIEVLGSIDAVMAQASEWLDVYPYGCAEQTASKLTSVLIAARSRRARTRAAGSEPEPLTPVQVHRLEVGYSKLRSLQKSSGGFSWWSGGPIDLEVSAYVFRTLALAEASGLSPKSFGLRTRGNLGIFKQALKSLAEPSKKDRAEGKSMPLALRLILAPKGSVPRAQQAAALSHCELVTTLLLLHSNHRPALKAVRALAQVSDRLPIGLASRVGLALVEADERTDATQVFESIRRRSTDLAHLTPKTPHIRLLAEDPAVLLSGLLRLCVLCNGPREFADRCVAALMRRNHAGRFDHSLGTANALIAMADYCQVYPPVSASEAQPRITVIQDGKSHDLRLDSKTSLRALIQLPAGEGQFVIRSSAGLRPLVTAKTRFLVDGANTKGWQTPLLLSRSLYRITTSADGQPLRSTLNDTVRVGELLEVVIKLKAPPALSRLLITCPIPAGFEVIPQRGLVVTDEEVRRGIRSLNADGEATLSFRMIASMPGRIAWPSAQSEAMYEAEKQGASRGGWLRVLHRAPADLEASAGKAVGLDRAHCLQTLEAAKDKVVRAATPGAAIQAARALSKLPIAGADRWIADDAGLMAMSEHFSEQRVAASWLGLCGARAKNYLVGQGLERLVGSTRMPRDEAIRFWARVITQKKLTRDVFLHPPATLLEARIHGLATAKSDFNAKTFRGPMEKMQLVIAWFQADDYKGSSAEKSVVLRERVLRHGGADWIKQPMRLLSRQTWTQSGLAHEADPEAARTAASAILDYARTFQGLWLEGDEQARAALNFVIPEVFGEQQLPSQGGGVSTIQMELRRKRLALAKPLSDLAMQRLSNLKPTDDQYLQLFLISQLCDKDTKVERLVKTLNRALRATRAPGDDRESWLESMDDILGHAEGLGSQEAYRVPALRLLGSNDQELWTSAWSLLPEVDQVAFPRERLITMALHTSYHSTAVETDHSEQQENAEVGIYDEDEDDELQRVQGWALANLWARGASTRADLLGGLASMGRQPRTAVLHLASLAELKTLPLDILLDAVVAARDDFDGNYCERLDRAVKEAKFGFASLAEALVSQRHFAARGYVLRLLANSKWNGKPADPANVSWRKDDLTAKRWRTLLEARLGNSAAQDLVRGWMSAKHAESMPEEEWELHWWAISPGLRREDLTTFEPELMKAEPAAVARILERMTTDELCALLDTPQASFLRHLSERTAARLIDPALRAWRLGVDDAWTIIERAPSSTLVGVLLPILSGLNEEQLKSVTSLSRQRKSLALSIHGELMKHSIADVRLEAAKALYKLTGVPRTVLSSGASKLHIGPQNQVEARTAVSKQLRRGGIESLEALLQSPVPLLRNAASEYMAKRGLALR